MSVQIQVKRGKFTVVQGIQVLGGLATGILILVLGSKDFS